MGTWSGIIWVGSKCGHKGLDSKEAEGDFTQMEEWKPCDPRGGDGSDAASAKWCQQPPEAKRDEEQVVLWSLQRMGALGDTLVLAQR